MRAKGKDGTVQDLLAAGREDVTHLCVKMRRARDGVREGRKEGKEREAGGMGKSTTEHLTIFPASRIPQFQT